MADNVTSTTLKDGSKYVVRKLTSISDGTGESAVVKIDVSTLTPVPVSVVIEEIWYSISGMVVTLFFDATTDQKILDLQGDGYMDLRNIGGIPDPKASGYTGDVLLTTTGHTNGDSYSLIIKARKE